MNHSYSPLRRAGAAVAVAALSAGLLTGLATSATAAARVSGPDWTATTVPGGVQVTLTPAEALPIVDDAPTLVIDGEAVGAVTETADGSLSVLLPGAEVDDIDTVELGWSSGDHAKVMPTNSPLTEDAADAVAPVTRKQLRAAVAAAAVPDGAAAGSYAYTQDDYDFGDQALPLTGIGGIRGEMTGRIYLPTTGGARPTVILLHGRHASCTVPPGGGSVSNPNRWPCIAPQVEIPSFKGYEVLGQTLATQGYAVVSISANAINANDAQLTVDNGALARGQEVIDTLAMLKKASAGEPVSMYDAATAQDVSLDSALLVDTAAKDLGTPAGGTLTAADLVGRFDLTDVGLMGHSRGGEGVVSAVTLNQALPTPFGITSVLPLAPVDFGRMTVADTPMLVMLPYCDGDVSNQQGQHFSDDSRRAFDDSVLRSTVWVMGANHNFFNTVWTPGKYALSTSDDWGATSTDTVCGPRGTGNQRLTDQQQYDTGVAVMAAWFRLTVGDETDFLPMFDGTTKPTLPSVPTADLRTIATAPAATRTDLETFTAPSSRARIYGTGSLVACASASGRTLPPALPFCATTSTVRGTSAMPHWTPASYAPNVPATPMAKFLWTSSTGEVRLTIPAGKRDASTYETLSFNTAPDEAVVTGTDFRVTVVDGAGASWTSLVSALNPLAVSRMPMSTSTTLNKIVMQQVSIPVASMTGLDLTDLREVKFAAATGADATANGGVYLSDLQLSTSGVGTVRLPGDVPTIGVDSTTVEEGKAPDEKQVAVVLSKPAATPVTGYFTLIGATTATAKAGLAMQAVTFAPGQTCVPVTVPTYGDSAASNTLTTSYKTNISNPQGVITGKVAFGAVVVREDDGTVNTALTPAPAVGAQGDVCAEYAAKSQVQALTASVTQPEPGDTVTVTGSGYRAGESVSFTDGGTVLGAAIADAAGAVVFDAVLPEDAAFGPHTITGVGAGSARTSTVSVKVLTATTTTLTIDPAAPAINQAVTLSAAVPTATDGDVVVFLDGATELGTGAVTGGVATLTVPGGFKAGEHTLTATYAETATTGASASNAVAFTLVKGATTTVVSLAAPTTTVGTGTTGTVTVSGVTTGTVTVAYAGTSTPVAITGGTGTFTIPGTLAAGTYPVTASFAGTDESLPSSATSVTYTVVKKVTGLAIALGSPSTPYGTGTTATVTLTGVPTGEVVVSYGATSTTVDVVDGVGTLELPATLAVGSYTVTASYAGSAEAAASGPVTAAYEVVKKATTVAVSLAAPSRVYGTGTTGTVTATGVSAGTVAVTYGSATTSVELVDGVGTFVLPATLGAGTYSVTATYGGSDVAEASAPATASYVVTKKATQLALKAAPASVAKGKKVTLTATVTGLVGSPRSTVVFKVSGKVLKTVAVTGSKATFSVVLPGTGKKVVTATYAGDANHGASTGSKTVTVKVPAKKKG